MILILLKITALSQKYSQNDQKVDTRPTGETIPDPGPLAGVHLYHQNFFSSPGDCIKDDFFNTKSQNM